MKKLPLAWFPVLALMSLVLGVFLYYPLLNSLKSAFFPSGGFSLHFFSVLLQNRVLTSALINSLFLGVIVTIACVIISLPLAWFSSRYRLPFQGLLNAIVLIPMILPPFVGAIGMKQFMSRFGTLNILLMQAGIIHEPIDWMGSGFWGVVVLETLHLFPIVYLNLGASLANINPALEEAAWNLGTSPMRFIRRILLPLAAPGLFAGCAIVFVWAVTDLGTPLVFDYRNIAAYQIYSMLNDINENPMGYALVTLTLLGVGVIYFTSKYAFRSDRTQMSTKGMRTTEMRRPGLTTSAVALSLFALVGAVAVVPHMMVVLTAIAKTWFMTALPERYTVEYLATIVNHPLTVLGIRNSVFLSSVTALVDIGLGVAAAYMLSRWRFLGRGLLDFSIMLPLAVPGLILAFGYVGTFAGTAIDPRVNPFPLLIAAYAVRRLPFMVRSVASGLQQMDPAMEEAASMLGASRMKTMTRITLPLVSANLIAGTILVFTFAMLEVSDSLILAMKENYYPLTKVIYALSLRLSDGLPVASALGVLAMIILTAGFVVAGKALGNKMGGLFRL